MTLNEVRECYELLLSACHAESGQQRAAYRQMRDLLERLCRDEAHEPGLQMTDLAARVNFLAAKKGLAPKELNRLHTFRLASNRVLNRQEEPAAGPLLRDAKTLAFLLQRLTGEEIPPALRRLLPQADATYLATPPHRQWVQRMRVCYLGRDEHCLHVLPLDEAADKPLAVRYNVPQVNDEFAATCQALWEHAQLNLLDVAIDDAGVLTPAFIVLEPDYLIDISSLAECFREYGHHPANYFFARLQPAANTRPLLLGNIANLFLDEWIHAGGKPVDYRACMQKAFRRYALELAACDELLDPDKERAFFADCRMHFDHIRDTVTRTFHEPGYGLNEADAVLEPSYICEPLGLQGRLDYMQRDMSAFIEMKSGKADEYAFRGKVEPKENNWVQMLLYQAVLQYSMGQDHRHVRAYLLYTRYPLLYPARSSWAMVRRAIDLRNRIVADEHAVQLHPDLACTAAKLDEINPRTMNARGLSTPFWIRYLLPPIEQLRGQLHALAPLERDYFHALYRFVTKEMYTAKSGDTDHEGSRGAAALWCSTLEEKREAGDIVYDLRIVENHAADEREATLLLQSPLLQQEDFLPNFRQGDAVLLYERNAPGDNATNKMVFKANVGQMDGSTVRLRLRAAQQNPAVLPPGSRYAMEHDTMDTTFRFMYQGLRAYLAATPRRRQLLLLQREPESDPALGEAIARATDDFDRVALKARAARDYFLLVGPPGTGKTSRALRRMVETFHAEEGTQILLLSYTNRAVDEICKSLSAIRPAVDFIRLGNELACDEAYRPRLLENVLASCANRAQARQRIARCRIVAGTVATVAGRPDLFRLKHFHVAIVDEATQILEPQLLGILCARDAAGQEAVDKFVLIGDHKQLPAVVMQSQEQTAVPQPSLQAIGLDNLRNSLFERLYRHVRSRGDSLSHDMLCRQGRMHPAVAAFANARFYHGQLRSLGLPHQQEDAGSEPRLAFFPAVAEAPGEPPKSNRSEAAIVAAIAGQVYRRHADSFDPARTLGIIAPYRSQIALIRKQLRRLGIPALEQVTIDTVERFQGSERDIIVYSFCVNRLYQIRQLASLTVEDGVLIDRKLNVALTRARKQLFLTGVPELLNTNPLYAALLEQAQKGEEPRAAANKH